MSSQGKVRTCRENPDCEAWGDIVLPFDVLVTAINQIP
jgi:hypothetical protein